MNLQAIGGDGFSLSSSIRGFSHQKHLHLQQQQPSNVNNNPNHPPPPSKKKRNLPGTPGNFIHFLIEYITYYNSDRIYNIF